MRTNPNFEQTQSRNKSKSFRVCFARLAHSAKTTDQIQKIRKNLNFEKIQNSEKLKSFRVGSTHFARSAKTTNRFQIIRTNPHFELRRSSNNGWCYVWVYYCVFFVIFLQYYFPLCYLDVSYFSIVLSFGFFTVLFSRMLFRGGAKVLVLNLVLKKIVFFCSFF